MSPQGGSAVAPSRDGYVVLERGGGLWGVAGSEVRQLRRHGAGMYLEVAGGELAAERILAVVPDLEVWPAPGAIGRFWPEAALGLAVYARRPVLVIDPEQPPASLLAAAAGEGAEVQDA